jgi:hypothetical protein
MFWSPSHVNIAKAPTSLRETKTSWPTLHQHHPGSPSGKKIQRTSNPRSPQRAKVAEIIIRGPRKPQKEPGGRLIIQEIIRDRVTTSRLGPTLPRTHPGNNHPAAARQAKASNARPGPQALDNNGALQKGARHQASNVAVAAGAKKHESEAPYKRRPPHRKCSPKEPHPTCIIKKTQATRPAEAH